LGNEKAPVEHWKAGVTTTQDGLEMVFESLDGTFIGIATMHVSGGQLVSNVLVLEVGFEEHSLSRPWMRGREPPRTKMLCTLT